MRECNVQTSLTGCGVSDLCGKIYLSRVVSITFQLAMSDYALLAVLLALLLGLVAGKAWERYKLRDGRSIDRRRLRETPHYMLGLNCLVDNHIDQAVDELTRATSTDTDALEIQMIWATCIARRDRLAGRSPSIRGCCSVRT